VDAISDPAVLPLRTFCKAQSITPQFFYVLRKQSLEQGKGDPIRKLGRKSMVFPEVAKAWLRSMTTAAA
jgi:hypothetical protein